MVNNYTLDVVLGWYMSIGIGDSIGSAFASGLRGLQSASDGVGQASSNIAQGSISGGVAGNGSVTSDVVSLTTNLTNAQASAKVLETTDEMIGRFINETV